MKNLFKALMVFVVVVSFSEAKAQMSAGPGVVYGTGINNIGFSINGKYEFNEKWSAAPSFTYFLKKDFVTWMALDLDANYQITVLENMGSLYAIGGLNMTFFNMNYEYDLGDYGGEIDGNISGSDVGVNLGLGLTVSVSEKLDIAPEIRYSLGGANYLRIGVKVMFKL